MALLSKTITNTLGVKGGSPGTLWGTAVFGTDVWGVDQDVWTETDKGIAETLALSDALGKETSKAITESMSLSVQLDVTRTWGIWDYQFTRPTSDGEQQVLDEFTKVSDNSSDYTSVTTPATEWS
jgi:hypothetical protein